MPAISSLVGKKESATAVAPSDAVASTPIDVDSLLARCMHDAEFARQTLEKFHHRALEDVELLPCGVSVWRR